MQIDWRHGALGCVIWLSLVGCSDGEVRLGTTWPAGISSEAASTGHADTGTDAGGGTNDSDGEPGDDTPATPTATSTGGAEGDTTAAASTGTDDAAATDTEACPAGDPRCPCDPASPCPEGLRCDAGQCVPCRGGVCPACGNGRCEAGEDCARCPTDCPCPVDPCTRAAFGDGDYCGQSLGGTVDHVYTCQGDTTVGTTPCQFGCALCEPFVHDKCRVFGGQPDEQACAG